MKRFRKSEYHELEKELRSSRPRPRSAFVASLVADVHGRARRPAALRRVALATALAAAMLTFFAGFGGVGYATSAAKTLDVSKIGRLVGISNAKPAKQHASKSQSAKSQSQPSKSTARTSSNSTTSRAFLKNNGDDDDEGPDDDQYKPGKGCGDKNHVHKRENECKKKK